MIIRLYILVAFFSFSMHCAGSDEYSLYSDSIPIYSKEKLEKRFGKITAQNILNHKVQLGYSHSMVYLALGKPYLIEEPIGKYMDYEIFHYKKYTIFFEYGVITHIRNHKKPSDLKLNNTTIKDL